MWRKWFHVIGVMLCYMKIIGKAMLCVYIFTHGFLKPIYVKGCSMTPTLKEGTLAVSNVFTRHITKLERFDIVLLQYEDELLIKRLIALPKETISYHNDQLYINNVPIAEDFLDKSYIEKQKRLWNVSVFTQDIPTYTLSENEYYVVGDNRLHSYDSRDFGSIQQEDILSKGILTLP